MKTVYLPFWSRWHTRPCDQGQAVERSYTVADGGATLLCCVHDRGDNTTEYRAAKIAAGDLREGAFEPWNNQLPRTVGEWTTVRVLEDKE